MYIQIIKKKHPFEAIYIFFLVKYAISIILFTEKVYNIFVNNPSIKLINIFLRRITTGVLAILFKGDLMVNKLPIKHV